jgi:hypothetical protein
VPNVKSLLPYLTVGLLAGVPMPVDKSSGPWAAGRTPAVDVLKPAAALPAHIAGSFQEITACQQSPEGDYFIFDRRAHSVYTATASLDQARKLIEIGVEPGRVLTPTAFDLARDGTFVIADAPRTEPRIQIFTTSGSTLGGFILQGRPATRIILRNLVLNGLGSVEYTGRSIYLSQPELGALVVEYAANGTAVRTFGALRRTGHESDTDVHLALNTGLVIASADGGVYFVFLAGIPQFRKYDAAAKLVFERHIEGPELDAFIERLPDTWKRQKTEDGLIPIVLPSVYAAAIDPRGQLWISLATGYTFVYDSNGEKRRTIQFHAAGPIAPTGLSFGRNGRVLVAPGCYAYDTADR